MDGVTYGFVGFGAAFNTEAKIAQCCYCYLLQKGRLVLELARPGIYEIEVPEKSVVSISGLVPHRIKSIGSTPETVADLNGLIRPVQPRGPERASQRASQSASQSASSDYTSTNGAAVESDLIVELIVGEVKNDALAFASAYSGMQLITPTAAPQLHRKLCAIFALIEDELMQPLIYSTESVRLLSEALVVNLMRFGEASRGDGTALNGITVPEISVDPRISRVMLEIGRNPTARWSVEALANLAGMSRTAFANSFKRNIGITPLKSVSHARLAKSIFELDKSARSIADIAERCGYSSAAAFIRAFQREFGLTPARWRKKA